MEPYKHPVLLANGHLQTIYPALFRKVRLPVPEKITVITSDDDFLDVDHYGTGNASLAILSHGLEGNSTRPYIKGMAKELLHAGFDVACWNFRGCSEKLNKQQILYHSGATYDLKTVVHFFSQKYQDLFLVGFSLGGNLTLKFLGEGPVSETIRKAAVISAPLDLKSGAQRMSVGFNRIYEKRFLRSLGRKILAKHRQYPEIFPLEPLQNVKNIVQFDESYTSRVHGFKDADDYYTRCSSKQFLTDITVPTLIINAKNDPLLPSVEEAELISANPLVRTMFPDQGGHCGFPGRNGVSNWAEKMTSRFFSEGI